MSRRGIVCAALLFASGIARAATLELSGVPAGALLAPGMRVVSSWTATVSCEEAELVLSLDGGETFPLRLTPEGDPDARAFSFRVPNLPSPHAVVALRTGGGGERETIRFRSPEFVIARDAASDTPAAEPLVALEGELATREAAIGADEPPTPAGLANVPARIGAPGDTRDAAERGFLAAALVADDSTAVLPEARFVRPAPRGALRAAVSTPKRE